VTRCSVGFSAIEALLYSPNDGDVSAIDIDEHAQDLGESTGNKTCSTNHLLNVMMWIFWITTIFWMHKNSCANMYEVLRKK
jgi:hypothetical protein